MKTYINLREFFENDKQHLIKLYKSIKFSELFNDRTYSNLKTDKEKNNFIQNELKKLISDDTKAKAFFDENFNSDELENFVNDRNEQAYKKYQNLSEKIDFEFNKIHKTVYNSKAEAEEIERAISIALKLTDLCLHIETSEFSGVIIQNEFVPAFGEFELLQRKCLAYREKLSIKIQILRSSLEAISKSKNSKIDDEDINIFIGNGKDLFERWVQSYVRQESVLADISFIYRKLYADGLIRKEIKPMVFVEWYNSKLSDGQKELEKLKTLNDCETTTKTNNYIMLKG